MIGGLHIPELFENINGSCLLDCSLNSILNSHALVKELYEFTPRTTTLDGNYINAMRYNKNEEINNIIAYTCLFSAYVSSSAVGFMTVVVRASHSLIRTWAQ